MMRRRDRQPCHAVRKAFTSAQLCEVNVAPAGVRGWARRDILCRDLGVQSVRPKPPAVQSAIRSAVAERQDHSGKVRCPGIERRRSRPGDRSRLMGHVSSYPVNPDRESEQQHSLSQPRLRPLPLASPRPFPQPICTQSLSSETSVCRVIPEGRRSSNFPDRSSDRDGSIKNEHTMLDVFVCVEKKMVN